MIVSLKIITRYATALLVWGLIAAQPAFAQRAIQSPLVVTVTRTKSNSNDQQIGLKINIRNMSNKPVDVRLEALFTAEPAYGRGREGIFSERKTSRSFEPGESHEFNTESDAGANSSFQIDGSYYSYSSLKIKGYMTRVFADGQLVNVTGSVPSLQKAAWDDNDLKKLGYSGPPEPAEKPKPAVVRREDPVTPAPAPAFFIPEDPATPPERVSPPPVAVAQPTPQPVQPVQQPVTPPKPAPTKWDSSDYTATAKRYNAAVDSYQSWLARRGTQATLKSIEDELHACVDSFEKMQDGAPAAYNIGGLLTNCRQTIFAVHATMQAQP